MTVATPSTELVDAYLTEIAKAYSVKWLPKTSSPGHGDGSDGDSKVGNFLKYLGTPVDTIWSRRWKSGKNWVKNVKFRSCYPPQEDPTVGKHPTCPIYLRPKTKMMERVKLPR